MELPLSEVSSPDVTETADCDGPSRPKKRSQVRHACVNCRTDKVKCSGIHPLCSRCKTRGLTCSYEVPLENMTKMQHLRSKIIEQERRLILVSNNGAAGRQGGLNRLYWATWVHRLDQTPCKALLTSASFLNQVNEIFDILQKGTDSEAAEALARLRIGEKPEEVVNSMRARMFPATRSKSPDTTVPA